MFIAAPFTTVKIWMQPKCPLTHEWIKKIWHIYIYIYIYIMEYYSATKNRNNATCSNMDILGDYH